MNNLLRRTAAALTLAFAAAAAMAQDKAPAPAPVPANDSEIMYPIAEGGIGGCLNDNHGGAVMMDVSISLNDIAKPGTTPSAEDFELAIFMAQLGDTSELDKKYDISKIDLDTLAGMLQEELRPVIAKYGKEDFSKGGAEVQAEVAQAVTAASKKFEAQTGITVALNVTGGAVSPDVVAECVATPAPVGKAPAPKAP
ncbi:MAG: hypothetical protein HYU57_04090 [Micavibrio aeruginosavorus]|nr:hypothetical protein [Micavibrio aeruginosavorus]